MIEIKLKDVLRIAKSDVNKYKLHLASRSDYNDDPFEIFLNDKDSWLKWNSGKRSNGKDENNIEKGKHVWTRDFILSFCWYENGWIFTGCFEVIDKENDKSKYSDKFKEYISRLKIDGKFKEGVRGYHYYLETYYDNLIVKEILNQPIEFKKFTGYKDSHLDFKTLENIVKEQCKEWKDKLTIIKGIYLIYDNEEKKCYVGSATGSSGIWQRWSNYIGTDGTGNNDKLEKLLKNKGVDYMKKNLEFTLLEYYYENQCDDAYILDRETFWKKVLHSRDEEIGYNCN